MNVNGAEAKQRVEEILSDIYLPKGFIQYQAGRNEDQWKELDAMIFDINAEAQKIQVKEMSEQRRQKISKKKGFFGRLTLNFTPQTLFLVVRKLKDIVFPQRRQFN
eukprot:TRINITY_DN794_c0_g1_i1.p1 TRINITY_DN794_c0_g1~~TRINITY_DN794_c0_g1_i1.p1  ORF type:complete len:106 (+),score=6.32 TRINITY_DN794_c0_g1_i1:271-588(+)